MSIQEDIRRRLDRAIADRGDQEEINNLKFLFAETQRGDNKEASDKEVIDAFVALIKQQQKVLPILSDQSKKVAKTLIGLICDTIPLEVGDQLFMQDVQILDWIERNVDMSKIKNKNQIIGIMKKEFPYVDGNLVKKVVEEMI